MKRNGDCQKGICHDSHSVFEGRFIVTGISPEATFAKVDLTIRGDEVGGRKLAYSRILDGYQDCFSSQL